MNPALATNLCGIPCENPYFLASSSVSGNFEMCARALEMGWAGVVYKTVGLHVPANVSPRFRQVGGSGMPFRGFRNIESISDRPTMDNLADIRRLKKQFPQKVVVVSIMAGHPDDWARLALLCQQHGADAVEFNLSCPHMDKENMGIAAAQNIGYIQEVCQSVTRGISIPALAKIGPSTLPPSVMAKTVLEAGVKGITATNTYPSISGFDFETGSYSPAIQNKSAPCGYSGRAIHPLALAQIAEIAKACTIDISGVGGIYTWKDALEAILLGASTVQAATAVMEYGCRIIDDLLDGLGRYLLQRGQTVAEIVGSAVGSIVQPGQLRRGEQHIPAINKETCVGCGRCYLSCRDGGHQAIEWEDSTRTPSIQAGRCVGCHLCAMVCPALSIGTAP